MKELRFTLNGGELAVHVRDDERLLDVLRERFGQLGTKEGCGKGECGACTVLIDGRVVNACLTLALEVEGCEVLTVEGLAGPGGTLSPVQQAFVDHGGIQCGFCTPGMILSAHALLVQRPDPTDDEIRVALAGNLCRCTGYVQIVESVRRAAQALADDLSEEPPAPDGTKEAGSADPAARATKEVGSV
ncbi:MAG: (2Fe-2S)-binding protein [Planctomycetota bacterium]|nr:MAG: (2Fe-2S)-binding protein [Planctomycetota bacterium]